MSSPLPKQLKDNPRIEFTGYVAEEDIPEAVPHGQCPGAAIFFCHRSQRCSPPCVRIRRPNHIGRNRRLSRDGVRRRHWQSISMKPATPTAWRPQLQALLDDDPERLREMSEQNFSAALRMTMPQIIRQYLRSFDLQQRARALEPISRFRRIPSWVPSRSAIFRAAAPRWQPWT